MLVTCGFPRSGNHFLNETLASLYYPQVATQTPRHNRKDFERYEKIIMPLRNPVNAIISSHTFTNLMHTLEMHVNFYVYFHEFAAKHKAKIVVMDFDKFTSDIDYIKTKIKNNYNLTSDINLTVEDIKNIMTAKDESIHLPRISKVETNLKEDDLKNITNFNKCLDLYHELKEQE